MKIDRGGQEYVRYPITGAPVSPGPVEITFDDEVTWMPMLWSSDFKTASVLVSGPNVAVPSGVVLALGVHRAKLRLTDTPEIVIRSAGSVTIG